VLPVGDSLDWSDAAAVKDGAQSREVTATIKITVGIDDGSRAAGEGRETVELKMAFQNYGICDVPSQLSPNIP
jgi:hypothetical protein